MWCHFIWCVVTDILKGNRAKRLFDLKVKAVHLMLRIFSDHTSSVTVSCPKSPKCLTKLLQEFQISSLFVVCLLSLSVLLFTVTVSINCLLSLSVLFVYCHCQYYLFTVTVSTICLLSLSVLYVYCHCQYYMFTVIVSTVCLLSMSVLFVYCHCQYYLFTVTVSTICLLSLWVLFVYCHCQYYLFTVTVSILEYCLEVVLCFWYRHSINSGNEVAVSHWEWFLMFVTVLFVPL